MSSRRSSCPLRIATWTPPLISSKIFFRMSHHVRVHRQGSIHWYRVSPIALSSPPAHQAPVDVRMQRYTSTPTTSRLVAIIRPVHATWTVVPYVRPLIVILLQP